MKRKSVFVLVAIAFCVLFSACGEQGANPTEKVKDNDVTQEIHVEDIAPTEEIKKNESSDPLEDFKDKLSQGGFSYETVPMGAELVGASRGEKYKFSFGTVELYIFEVDSDALGTAKENGGLTLEGFGVFPCEFNGNIAMLIDVTESEDQIKEIFTSIS